MNLLTRKTVYFSLVVALVLGLLFSLIAERYLHSRKLVIETSVKEYLIDSFRGRDVYRPVSFVRVMQNAFSLECLKFHAEVSGIKFELYRDDKDFCSIRSLSIFGKKIQISGFSNTGRKFSFEADLYLERYIIIFVFCIWLLLTTIITIVIGYFLNSLEDAKGKAADALCRANFLESLNRQVSHDIQSPITALKVGLKMSKLPNDLNEFLSRAINRSEQIFEDLKNLSKNSDERYCKFDLNDAVASIVKEKNSDILLFDSSEIVFVKLPLSRIQRMVSNLVDNAIQAPKCTFVRVELKKNGGKAVLSIQDNGAGFPKVVLDKIGTKFLTVNKAGGTGLGVYSAVETTKKIGAKIFFKNTNVGARVEINFEIAD